MEAEKNLIKYIVYKTTCIKNNKIYIGVHKLFINKNDYYIGCGIFSNKKIPKNNNTLFAKAVRKYGVNNFKREILYEFDNIEDALKMEEKLVNKSFLKRKDVYNIALGGGYPPHLYKKVYQYDINGNFLNEFNSIKEAAIFLNEKYLTVGTSIRKKHLCKGYIWSYTKVDKINTWKIYNKKRKVAVYDKNNNLIKIYNSVRDCKKDYCGCPNVLAGRRKTSKSCTFKYID